MQKNFCQENFVNYISRKAKISAYRPKTGIPGEKWE